MNVLCVRVDLDYVPWDTPDARQFGHGEPAMLIRLLDRARTQGYRLHFFASERFLRAFPTGAEAVLNEGHDLDYLAKHPEDPSRLLEATRLFSTFGHAPLGWAIRQPLNGPPPDEVQFFSGPSRVLPGERDGFPTLEPTLHDAMRAGEPLRDWLTGLRKEFQAPTELPQTIVLSPQVLARTDPQLTHLIDLVESALGNGWSMRTLRQLI